MNMFFNGKRRVKAKFKGYTKRDACFEGKTAFVDITYDKLGQAHKISFNKRSSSVFDRM